MSASAEGGVLVPGVVSILCVLSPGQDEPVAEDPAPANVAPEQSADRRVSYFTVDASGRSGESEFQFLLQWDVTF